MKRLRVMVLMHQDLVPPETLKGYTEKEIQEWKTEYDVVTSLHRQGHEVKTLGVHDDLAALREPIDSWKPDITFNLLEEFHGQSLFDYHVVSYLELRRQHYTGCNPRGLMLAHDKALSKKLLYFHRISVPGFMVIPIGKNPVIPSRLKFPLFVKSLVEDGSYGIAQASVVHNEEKFRERVQYLHEQLDTPVIAEEYIEGREFYVSVIGNTRLQTLPVIELKFGSMPEDIPRIATSKVKWDLDYQEKYKITAAVPKDLTEELELRISRVCKRIYRILGLSGYARIDLRVTDDGRIFVLEANPNPDIGHGSEICMAAEAAGIDYDRLIQRVINHGLKYTPELRLV